MPRQPFRRITRSDGGFAGVIWPARPPVLRPIIAVPLAAAMLRWVARP